MKIYHYFLVLASVLLLASCGSKKKVIDAAGGNPMLENQPSLTDIVQKVNANRVTEPCVTAKINVGISSARKSAKVGGTLRMKRNDVIQLSLVALGLMEVGRLELTPDYMMLMDRMNHQFVKCDYDDVDFFREAGVNFYTFQSLFWDELFVLNSKGEAPVIDNYSVRSGDDGAQLLNTKGKNMALTFVVNAATQIVEETRFSVAEGEDPVLKWKYADWTKLGDRNFPGLMKIAIALSHDNVEAVIKIGSVKSDSNWETRTEINRNRYNEVPVESVFDKLINAAQ
ncbi:MAG: DUF4292 domain-containing protein [Bacteroidaceae bacterium]|nr:DUF4292 domain-containing protein [Bacteroidaceae bacterium]